jgi:hypothetical protein
MDAACQASATLICATICTWAVNEAPAFASKIASASVGSGGSGSRVSGGVVGVTAIT